MNKSQTKQDLIGPNLFRGRQSQRKPSSLVKVEDRSKDLKIISPISGPPLVEDEEKVAWRKAQEAVRAESHYEPVIVEEIMELINKGR
ncbi:hypothetical protein U1Q18_009852 [Sarracenia purpurea var. burkii]